MDTEQDTIDGHRNPKGRITQLNQHLDSTAHSLFSVALDSSTDHVPVEILSEQLYRSNQNFIFICLNLVAEIKTPQDGLRLKIVRLENITVSFNGLRSVNKKDGVYLPRKFVSVKDPTVLLNP